MNKGMLAPSDLVVIDLEGRQLSGERKASSELAMHLLFYRMRPDVMAICHAHPPTATGFAVVGRALDQALLPEVIVGLGQIPLVKYGTPGTPELSAAIEPYVMHYDALLLGQPRRGDVWPGPAHRVLSHGDDRAFRENHAGSGRREAHACCPAAKLRN